MDIVRDDLVCVFNYDHPATEGIAAISFKKAN